MRRLLLLRKTPHARGILAGTIGLLFCGPAAATALFWSKGGSLSADPSQLFGAIPFFSTLALFCLPLVVMAAFVFASLIDVATRKHRRLAWVAGTGYAIVVALISVGIGQELLCGKSSHCTPSDAYQMLLFASPAVLLAGIVFGEWSYRAHQKNESIKLSEVFFAKGDTISEEGQLSVTSGGELSQKVESVRKL